MDSKYQYLSPKEVEATIERLCLRINDRFPGSDLSLVCQELLHVSRQTDKTLKWINKPNYYIRIPTYMVIGGVALATVYTVVVAEKGESLLHPNLPLLISLFGDTLEGLGVVVAAIAFVVTIETRRKRAKVISAINGLRSLAHVIDAHQLTKDPHALSDISAATPHSPKRAMGEYELGRYLNYCSEMLSLASKVGFLYAQKFPDPEATEAVNDLETLTSDLSQNIWQKIQLIRTK